MKTSKIDQFKAELSRIEKYAKAKNIEQLRLSLHDFYKLPLHEYGQENSQTVADLWDKFFSLMLKLIRWDDIQIKNSAFHNIKIGLWSEKLSNRIDTHFNKILPVFGVIFEEKQEWFLEFFDYFIYFLETPHPLINKWLNDIEKGKTAPHLQKNYIEAAKIFYFYPKKTWDEAKYFLFSALDHSDILVRAYAAKVLGMWYYNHATENLSPSLKETIKYLTEREINRPGIAGPFISEYYLNMEIELFEKESGLNIKEWIFEILEKRKTAEPDTLPCSNGLDFYSHEIFSTREELLHLIKIGQIAIAQESAGDNNLDFKKILLEIKDHDDPKVIRDVSFALASYYKTIHPKGQKLGMVKVFNHLPNIEIILLNFDINTASYWHSILISPKKPKDNFTDKKAWELIEWLLPPSIRGKELHRSPWDDEQLKQVAPKYPWTYVTYTNRASIRLDGSNSDKIWKKITINSILPLFLWDPETLLNFEILPQI
ncbi:hypothetical protein A2230_03760 [candidate division WOR-1 bacterium RIFOXYA2_FULL_36_21]|uniref:Uncharacterized protein n=1 Tax=candidate division WOR-1 bacterium RIFOXYB2_FULL_36_35 TaxID=1802578 RepID=A0A1F4S1Y6_UNCSA|nr:MAG: hypothetical protein A2230_03760 [candidate division WOR-1 bacterium RIFOXYA2_FULL_36_21]OGC14442.1 MAG: hypothetical protein A2290_08455 [candidate division WOR-1 bacterium RIFOXYB2_FULL_36_35]